LLAFVRDVLKKHNIEYTKEDYRQRPNPNMPELLFSPPTNYEERPYQEFTIQRSLTHTRGIIGVATGGGKTMMVTRLINEIKTYPFIFYVLTKDLMEQAHDELSSNLNVPIGKIGDGIADFKKISVCTIQTAIRALTHGNSKFKISDYKFDEEDAWDEKGIENAERAEKIRKLIRMAKGIYFDETHHASAKTCRQVLEESRNAFWRYGGSATPYRESGDDIMIQAMFGNKIVDISASYLIKNEYLVKPYIFFEPIDSNLKLHSYPKIYKHCITGNDFLNKHVADTAQHLTSNNLSTLILVQHYPQGDFIKSLLGDVPFVTGRMTTSRRKNAIADLKSGRINCMIATSLADEGLDIPTLDSVLLAGGGASSTRVNQRIGRTLRKPRDPNAKKDKSIVIVYEHNARYLKDHVKKVRRILKKEPEFVLKDSKGPDFICSEIDKVMGIESKEPRTIFDM